MVSRVGSMSRVANAEVGEAEMGAVMSNHIQDLIAKGGKIYASMNMKSGVDNALLEASSEMLQELLALDPRGGYFSQDSVELGVLTALKAKGMEQRWFALGHDVAEVAYNIRVMLAHLRCKKGVRASDALKGCIEQIDTSVNKKAVERTKRPHPFVHFREGDSEEVAPAAAARICCRMWTGTSAMAFDEDGGGFKAASYYEKDGMAVARWDLPGVDDLELEIPASRIVGSNIVLGTPGSTKKRPAAADGDGVEVVDERATKTRKREAKTRTTNEDEQEGLVMKVMPGHGVSARILLQSSHDCKDRAQIFEIQGKASSDIVPREFCGRVVLGLEGFVKTLAPPVKGASWLSEVRKFARDIRDEILTSNAAATPTIMDNSEVIPVDDEPESAGLDIAPRDEPKSTDIDTSHE